jgi:glycolate oxidase
MEMEISGPALELMWRLKKAFDPNGILNPGKIFP